MCLLGWCCLPLLPARFFPGEIPKWWRQLADYAADLPSTLSPQPWLTADGALTLAAGLLALAWFCAQDFEPETRHRALRWFAGGVALLAATCLLFHWIGYQPALWYNRRHFGPFPSRNQTGDLLGIGGVIAGVCALEGLRKRQSWGWWHLAGALVIVAALFLNTSRGGVATLFVGLALYGGSLVMAGRARPAAGLLAAGLIGVAIVAGLFAGAFSERLAATHFDEADSFFGFRQAVYRDAFHALPQVPWTGLGLGNFEAVFPYYRQASLNEARLVHPESDWFWAALELGPAGLALALLAAGTLAPGVATALRGRAWPLERGALAACGAFVFHSFFDVPVRLLGTALPALLLLGLAKGVSPLRPAAAGARWLFRGCGLAVAAGGLYLIAAAQFSPAPWPGQAGAARGETIARRELRANHDEAALEAAETGLRSAPLSWQLRFQKATALLRLHRAEEAAANFKTAKLLQPWRADLPAIEAEQWLRVFPPLAMPAWREAAALDPSGAPRLFERAWFLTATLPAIRVSLQSWAQTRGDLFATWCKLVPAGEVLPALAAWRREDPALEKLNPEQLHLVLFAWWLHDRTTLRPLLEQNPRWLDAAWETLARQLAAENDFSRAYALARQHAPPPSWPAGTLTGDSLQLRHRLATNPDDFAAAYALARSAEKSGDLATTAFLLGRTADRPQAPEYFAFYRAEIAAQREDWPTAWKYLARYLKW